MSIPDPYNIKAKDPQDLVYVSKKNWARKTNVEDNNKLGGAFGRPGPLSAIVLSLIDNMIYFFLKFVFYIYDITQYAFTWANNITFGNFTGIIPKSYGSGKVISTKFFRYTMNVLLPPFGVMLSKGFYGWFNVLVCILLTYINYLAGIVYAFVITSRNRYADQYEHHQLQQLIVDNPDSKAEEDISAFLSSMGFLSVLFGLFYFIFSFF